MYGHQKSRTEDEVRRSCKRCQLSWKNYNTQQAVMSALPKSAELHVYLDQ